MSDDEDDEEGTGTAPQRVYLRVCTLDGVAVALGTSRQRAEQIERRALLKLKFALEIAARLGPEADAVLAGLRGAPLRAFKAALHETDASGCRPEGYE